LPRRRNGKRKGRVASGIAPRSSHRSGRAQLRHPVRPVMDSLSRFAIRGCAVDPEPGYRVPDGFPTPEATTNTSLPSTGSPRYRFPGFNGTTKVCDFLCPSRRASLPSLGDTMWCVCRFAPSSTERWPRAWGSSSGPHSRKLRMETTQDLPGSWRILVCLRPALRPRQDRLARPYDVVGAAPATSTTRAPATIILSGLHHTAWALAVYAS